tara:strand:- start:744 stop:1439 length:696 start_codon:yes stop_codon:yes gene_type:complete
VQSRDTVLGDIHRKIWIHLYSVDGRIGFLVHSGSPDRVPVYPEPHRMRVHEMLREWLIEAAEATLELAARSEIEEGARKFREAIELAPTVPYQAQILPVLRNLDQVGGSPRANKFVELAPHLRWVQSHRWDDQGEDRALCVLSEAFDLPGLEVGIMYVDQGSAYPLHNHPPQELYLIVSGHAHWRYGGAEQLVEMRPNSTLYNNPLDLHTVEAGDTPLVALYVLWGEGVRT